MLDTLGQRIVRGAYPSGQTLPHEDELTEGLGVSRTILREALRTLAAKGMVRPRQRVGTLVTDRRDWDLLDADVIEWHACERRWQPDLFRQVSEARLVIEPAAAAMAATRGDRGAKTRIDRAMKCMLDARNDLPAYLSADIDFHRAIYDAAGNELLGQIGGVMVNALHLSHMVTSRTPDPIERSIPMHVAVTKAVRRGAGVSARRAMRRLVLAAIRDLEESLGCKINVDDG